jgi:hypothetical protein
MPSEDPRQALIELLSRTAGEPVRQADSTLGWRIRAVVTGLARRRPRRAAVTYHSDFPFDVDASTVVFRKERGIEGRRVYAVTFEDAFARQNRYIFPVERHADGRWSVVGGSGGSAYDPERSRPCVNLAGGGWPQHFYAGGRLLGPELGVASVRLRFANEVLLEDTVDDGLVLFLTGLRVELPALAELCDRNQQVVRTDPAFAAAKPIRQE